MKYKLMDYYECIIKDLVIELYNIQGNTVDIRVWDIVKKAGLYPVDKPEIIFNGIIFINNDGMKYSYKCDILLNNESFSFFPESGNDLLKSIKNLSLSIHDAHIEMYKEILNKLKTPTILPLYDGTHSFCDIENYLVTPPYDDPMYVNPKNKWI